MSDVPDCARRAYLGAYLGLPPRRFGCSGGLDQPEASEPTLAPLLLPLELFAHPDRLWMRAGNCDLGKVGRVADHPVTAADEAKHGP